MNKLHGTSNLPDSHRKKVRVCVLFITITT